MRKNRTGMDQKMLLRIIFKKGRYVVENHIQDCKSAAENQFRYVDVECSVSRQRNDALKAIERMSCSFESCDDCSFTFMRLLAL